MFIFSKAPFSLLILYLVFSTTHAWAEEEKTEPAPEKANIEKNAADKEQKNKTTKTEKKSASTNEHDHNHEIIINPPMDAFKQQQEDIKRYIKSDEIESLLVGSDEFLLLTDKQTTAVNKGVMILIPDWQQSAVSSNAIKQLRTNMPNKGWTTLTLHPPHGMGNYPSQALTAEDRAKENTDSLSEYKKTLSTLMAQVIKKAENYPGAILIVAQGQHSAIIIDSIESKLIEPPAAVIMLSGYMLTESQNKKLTEQVAMSEYPILDLYLKHDSPLVLASMKHRKDRANNEMKISYRQKQLSNRVVGYYPKQTLTREIIGWLKSQGW